MGFSVLEILDNSNRISYMTLSECIIRNDEVVGSIPTSSTNLLNHLPSFRRLRLSKNHWMWNVLGRELERGLGVFFFVVRRKIEVQGSGLQCRLHGPSACERRELLQRSPLLSSCKGATGCVPPIARAGRSNLFPGRNIRTRAT